MAAPYIEWPLTAIQFLFLRVQGYSITEALERVWNPRTEKMGSSTDALEGWRKRYPSFVHAEKQIAIDPTWLHTNVANPMMIAASDWAIVQGLLGINGKTLRGGNISAPRTQLALQEMGLLEPSRAADRLDDLLKEYMAFENARRKPLPAPDGMVTITDPVVEYEETETDGPS